MPKKLTHEEFLNRIKIKNPNIEILSKYINSRTKIECKCKICGHIWYPKAGEIKGCPECDKLNRSNKLRKTHEQFIKELENINPYIEVLDKYINNNTKIECRCKKDGYIWKTRPRQLLSGNGCPKCWEIRNYTIQTKNNEQFIEEMKVVNHNVIILSEYKNSYTHVECMCKIDNHKWKATPTHLLRGRGCPKCDESKGEKNICKILDEYNIKYYKEYTYNDCKFYNVLPFDFYLPDYNTLIEYDGKQHFEIIDYFGGYDRFVTQIIRDTIKNIYCKNNNIKLIRTPYWDYNKIEEILIEKLNLK